MATPPALPHTRLARKLLKEMSDKADRTLVIFPGALGDLVCLAPTLRALAGRHQPAPLELMARRELAQFAVGRFPVAVAHSIDRREVSALFLRSPGLAAGASEFFGRFACVYSFFAASDETFRRNLVAACAAGKVSFHPFRPDGRGHVAAAYLRSIGTDERLTRIDLNLAAGDRENACAVLNRCGLSGGNFVLILPGSGSAAKNWPAAKFAQLAARLLVPAAALLGPAEAGFEPRFAGLRIISEVGPSTAAALAQMSACFIGNDSGVSHLAAAAGARGVVLFGPSDPARWRPLGEVEVIRHAPLDGLGVEQVLQALARIRGGLVA